jgi:hypothetical protein
MSFTPFSFLVYRNGPPPDPVRPLRVWLRGKDGKLECHEAATRNIVDALKAGREISKTALVEVT